MDDYIAIVQHGPASTLAAYAIDMEGTNILLKLEGFQHGVFNCFGLPLVVDGGDDEVSSNTGQFVNVEENNISSLFFLDDVYNLPGQ